MNLPPLAVLSGYIIIGSYMLSPSVVTIDDTDWNEPILLWLTICMPTGSGKSSLFRHLLSIYKVFAVNAISLMMIHHGCLMMLLLKRWAH